jgi:hypothetical protein
LVWTSWSDRRCRNLGCHHHIPSTSKRPQRLLATSADCSRGQIAAEDTAAGPMPSPPETSKSSSTPDLSWFRDTPPSTPPSLLPSTDTTPELRPLPTPTTSPNLSFHYELLNECDYCHQAFTSLNGDPEGITGRIKRHQQTACPKLNVKEEHKCRVCNNVYGRSDTKLKHEREKHPESLSLPPKRKKLEAVA